MATFRLTLEYDGAGFEGWQVQTRPGCRTVQGTLEAAVRRVTGESVRVVGSGRTDTGVHAEGQVASLVLEGDWQAERLARALNGVLPTSVAVVDARAVPTGFDARRHALGKRYRYRIWNGPVRSPLRSPRALHAERPLDLGAMRRAARDLVGSHDFAAFQAAGSQVKTTERTLWVLEIRGEPGGEVDLDFEGSGFLRHMVRNLVGTLLEVGAGRRDPASMPALLAGRDRSRAGPTAPPQGLALVAVRYPAGAPGAAEVSSADSAGSA